MMVVWSSFWVYPIYAFMLVPGFFASFVTIIVATLLFGLIMSIGTLAVAGIVVWTKGS